MVLKQNLHHHQMGNRKQHAGAPETAAKSVRLILLLSVSDYKRVDKSLYFIISTSTRG